ncbi:ABC transporter permease [Gemella massiliensis]|uniref:ABC transporter permease n=1 Tax=Gemella massiliensis TaxID=1909670 RepID=UPI000931480F|nr:ABC transporter permease subunit [Gemella massiliensis]
MAKKIFHNRQAVFSLLLVILVITVALFAPFIAPNSPYTVNISEKFLPASSTYPLGTDQLGRCVFSRLVYGARYSLSIAFPTLLILAFISTIVGTVSAWFEGVLDKIILIVCDIFMAFPPMVIVLALLGIIGQGAVNLIISIVFSMWIWFVKVIRSYILIEKRKNYIIAATISGCNSFEIIFKHIFPNIAPLIIVYFSTGIAAIILMISGYSFLGIGLADNTPEWGVMLSNSKQYLYSNPMLIMYPGLCILLTSAGFNILGEALRDVLSPKEY